MRQVVPPPAPVIPAQAGTQSFRFHFNALDSRLRGNDGTLVVPAQAGIQGSRSHLSALASREAAMRAA
jgi:hypothetical protein